MNKKALIITALISISLSGCSVFYSNTIKSINKKVSQIDKKIRIRNSNYIEVSTEPKYYSYIFEYNGNGEVETIFYITTGQSIKKINKDKIEKMKTDSITLNINFDHFVENKDCCLEWKSNGVFFVAYYIKNDDYNYCRISDQNNGKKKKCDYTSNIYKNLNLMIGILRNNGY